MRLGGIIAALALLATPALAQVNLPRTTIVNNAQPVFCINPTTALPESCAGTGGGGGAGAVYGPTADGSPAANPPVLIGGTSDGTGTGTVGVAQVSTAGALTTAGPTADGVAASSNPNLIAGTSDGSGTGTTDVLKVDASGNASVNEAQVSGTAVSVNNGTTDAGTERVTLSSDSTGQVKLATGANVIGSISNTSFAATQATAASLNATVVNAAGSAIIGKVGIDQTTPGTTNGVQVLTGSTTAVTQATAANLNATVVVAAGTANIGSLSPSGVTTTSAAGTVTTGGTFQSVLASNTSRKGCVIQNPVAATETLFVFFGANGSATTGSSFGLAPGAAISCTAGLTILTDNVSVTATTTSHAFVVTSQ